VLLVAEFHGEIITVLNDYNLIIKDFFEEGKKRVLTES